MEEKSGASTKPLRSTANKLKDLYDTYIRNEESRMRTDTQAPEQEEHLQKESDENLDSAENHDEQTVDTNLILDLVEKFDKIAKERAELQEQLKRMAAEMDNFRKRTLREKQELIDYANERLLYNLLPLLDDMQAAIDAGRQGSDYDALLKGLEMIHAKAVKLFSDNEVKKMDDPVGKPFDVDFHEALMHIPSDVPEGHVVQEVQPGYFIKEKVLRHARVITSAGKPEVDE
jgi:molecular chaperone GrpE